MVLPAATAVGHMPAPSGRNATIGYPARSIATGLPVGGHDRRWQQCSRAVIAPVCRRLARTFQQLFDSTNQGAVVVGFGDELRARQPRRLAPCRA